VLIHKGVKRGYVLEGCFLSCTQETCIEILCMVHLPASSDTSRTLSKTRERDCQKWGKNLDLEGQEKKPVNYQGVKSQYERTKSRGIATILGRKCKSQFTVYSLQFYSFVY
jgi:hypothetical protein